MIKKNKQIKLVNGDFVFFITLFIEIGCVASEEQWWDAVMNNKKNKVQTMLGNGKKYYMQTYHDTTQNKNQKQGFTALMYVIEQQNIDLMSVLLSRSFKIKIRYQQLLKIHVIYFDVQNRESSKDRRSRIIKEKYFNYLTPANITHFTYAILLGNQDPIEYMCQEMDQNQKQFLIEDKSDMNFIRAAVLVSNKSIFDKFTTQEMEKILENESKEIINCLTIAIYTNNKCMIQKLMSYKSQKLINSFEKTLDLRAYFGLDYQNILASQEEFQQAQDYFEQQKQLIKQEMEQEILSGFKSSDSQQTGQEQTIQIHSLQMSLSRSNQQIRYVDDNGILSSRYNEDKYEEEITETDDIYSEDKLISIEPSKTKQDDYNFENISENQLTIIKNNEFQVKRVQQLKEKKYQKVFQFQFKDSNGIVTNNYANKYNQILYKLKYYIQQQSQMSQNQSTKENFQKLRTQSFQILKLDSQIDQLSKSIQEKISQIKLDTARSSDFVEVIEEEQLSQQQKNQINVQVEEKSENEQEQQQNYDEQQKEQNEEQQQKQEQNEQQIIEQQEEQQEQQQQQEQKEQEQQEQIQQEQQDQNQEQKQNEPEFDKENFVLSSQESVKSTQDEVIELIQ